MKQKLLCFLLFLFCCGFCTAQQVVSSGGYAVKSEISVDWVLGGNVSALPKYNPSVYGKVLILDGGITKVECR